MPNAGHLDLTLGRRVWRITWRLTYEAGVAVALGYWGLFGLFLAVLRCDDNCQGDQADSWRYSGQLVLVLVGISVGIASMVLVWTRYTRAFRVTLVLLASLGFAWFEWLSAGSF